MYDSQDRGTRRIGALSAKQIIAVLFGPGLFGLALDSAIEHFVGKGGVDNQLQLIPAVFGPIGGVALLLLGVKALKLSQGAVRWVLRGVGLLAAAVGISGGVFHVLPLLEDLKDEELTRGAIEGAIGSAPPLFAPLAFTVLGFMLIAIASPRLLISFSKGEKQAEPAEPIDLADARRKVG